MAALLVAILTYMVLFFSKQFRENPGLRRSAFLAMTLHHVAAYYNCYVNILPGADGDAELFYEAAAATYGDYNYSTMLYTRFVNFVFNLVGPSKLLGCELSILAYAFSCLLIVDILRQIGCSKYAAHVILLYGILPSPIVHFSVTLRESYQALALLAVASSTLRLRKQFSLISLSSLILGLLCLLKIHNSLKFLVLALTVVSIFALIRARGKGLAIGLAVLVAAAILGGPGSIVVDESDVTRQIEKVHEYREGVIWAKGRAFYGGQVDTNSISAFALSAPKVFLLFMLAPFPWQIQGALDLYTFFENSIRLLFIWAALTYWPKTQDEEAKGNVYYLLTAYIVTEGVWSLGTGNWGTALRHHVVALALIISVGLPALLRRGELVSNEPETHTSITTSKKSLRTRRNLSQRESIRHRRSRRDRNDRT